MTISTAFARLRVCARCNRANIVHVLGRALEGCRHACVAASMSDWRRLQIIEFVFDANCMPAAFGDFQTVNLVEAPRTADVLRRCESTMIPGIIFSLRGQKQMLLFRLLITGGPEKKLCAGGCGERWRTCAKGYSYPNESEHLALVRF